MKKVRIYVFTACACAALTACSDTESVEINPDYNYTNTPFQFEAIVPAEEQNFSGNIVEMGSNGPGRFFNLFYDEACCNLSESPVKLELYHDENGDPGHPDVEGTIQITCDSDNSLCGTYSGDGERSDCRCDISCIVTTSTGRGIFRTEKTQLKLDITGFFEQGNPEPVAYKTAINGYLRVPKAFN